MIFKFDSGGVTPPYVAYQPVIVSDKRTTATQEESLAAKATKDSESGKLTSKDLYTMLKEKLKGLPSDVGAAMKQLQQLEQLSAMDFDDTFTQSIESKYLSTLQTMNQLSFSREQYDKALDTVKSNGGLDEAAIDQYGNVYMTDGKNFKTMTPEDAKKSGWKVVTNQDLLYMRANDPTLASNDNLLNIVNNGIGIKQVNELINNAISKIGTDTNTKEGYTAKDQGQIISGVNILKEAISRGLMSEDGSEISIDGLYKAKIINEDQLNQAKLAIQYVENMLPENAKTLLRLRSDGTAKGLETMIGTLIGSKLNNKHEFSLDLQKDLNPDGTKKDSKTDKDKDEYSLAEAFQLDKGDECVVPINAGTMDTLKVQATRLPVTTKDGGPLGVTTLDKVANESAYSGIFNFSQVTMGNQTLDMSALQNISVDCSAIYKMYLPVDQEKLASGVTAPNLGYLKTLEKVRNEISHSGAKTPEAINAIYQKYNLPKFVNPDGSVNEQYYAPFGVMNATALSDAFSQGASLDNDYLEEVTDDNVINNTWKVIKGANTKETMDKKSMWDSVASLWGGGDWQAMYKGQIYLPLRSINPTLGAYSAGKNLTRTQLDNNAAAMQQNERLQSFKPQGQL